MLLQVVANFTAVGRTGHKLAGESSYEPITETKDECREWVEPISNSARPTSPGIWFYCKWFKHVVIYFNDWIVKKGGKKRHFRVYLSAHSRWIPSDSR